MRKPFPMPETQASLAPDDLELLARAKESADRLKLEIAKVIIGQNDTVRAILAAVFSQGHTLVIGVPGLAKTLLVKTVARRALYRVRSSYDLS